MKVTEQAKIECYVCDVPISESLSENKKVWRGLGQNLRNLFSWLPLTS